VSSWLISAVSFPYTKFRFPNLHLLTETTSGGSLEITINWRKPLEFDNTFTVPTDINTAWENLTDFNRIAACFPGATLETVEGDTCTGRVKVKIGPINLTYRGTAQLTEADVGQWFAQIEAGGKEIRGSGAAKAKVSAKLSEVNGGTQVRVVTNLDVTGRPAQFGRGAMADVGTNIIGTFAERLETLILSDRANTVRNEKNCEVEATSNMDSGGIEREIVKAQSELSDALRGDDALDLLAIVGPKTLKLIFSLVAGLATVIALVWRIRRR